MTYSNSQIVGFIYIFEYYILKESVAPDLYPSLDPFLYEKKKTIVTISEFPFHFYENRSGWLSRVPRVHDVTYVS